MFGMRVLDDEEKADGAGDGEKRSESGVGGREAGICTMKMRVSESDSGVQEGATHEW